jgi:hypothetical protein
MRSHILVWYIPCNVYVYSSGTRRTSLEDELKLNSFDLLWICCTTGCTTNPHPQQIEQVEFELHNASTLNSTRPTLFQVRTRY